MYEEGRKEDKKKMRPIDGGFSSKRRTKKIVHTHTLLTATALLFSLLRVIRAAAAASGGLEHSA